LWTFINALSARRLTSMTENKYCIIGAGPSGLAAAKNFKARNLPFDCFERQNDVGGNWYYGQPASSVCHSTHLISSKRMTEYTDFPMPREFPQFPSHQQALAYLRDYARHFELMKAITFSTSVERVEPEGSQWRVSLSDGTSRIYRGVVIANGHHWDPFTPEFPGHFDGPIIHSRDYKTPDQIAGQRVLVIGAGNSGCDLAVEAAQHATSATISLRRGYYFLPKFLYGRPIDTVGETFHRLGAPLWLRRTLARYALRIAVGSLKAYGLPQPDHRLFESHPIVNSQLPYFAGHGKVRVRPQVERFQGDRVKFTDGREESFDLIVMATGFKVSFPFIDMQHLHPRDGAPELRAHVFHPTQDNLFVVGLIQPDSGLWGLADYQAQLAAAWVAAQQLAPEKAPDLWRMLTSEQSDFRGGVAYLDSPRHRYEVEHFSYRRRLQKLLKRFGELATAKLPEVVQPVDSLGQV